MDWKKQLDKLWEPNEGAYKPEVEDFIQTEIIEKLIEDIEAKMQLTPNITQAARERIIKHLKLTWLN